MALVRQLLPKLSTNADTENLGQSRWRRGAKAFHLRAQLPFSRERNSASEIGAVRPGGIAGFGFVAAFGVSLVSN